MTTPDFNAEQAEYLTVDPRMYSFIRLTAIKNIDDAIVEMVTNSIDAYHRMGLDNSNNLDEIELDYTERTLINRDQALGMTGDEMVSKLMTIGSYTSTVGSRGFFSRGAKDLSAIGNVQFDSIKDGLYSQTFINTKGQSAQTHKDEPVSQAIRDELKITNNGIRVKIYLKDILDLPTPDTLVYNIENHYSLRDIISDAQNTVNLKTSGASALGESDIEKELVFEKPTGDLIVDMKYTVPGYGSDATVDFKLYKSPIKIPEPENEKYMKFGLMVKSDVAVHENSCLYSTLRYHPMMQYLFGTINCNYIEDMMYQIDAGDETILNPYPIIDHSRTNGLVRGHPFVKALYSIPFARISVILDEMNSNEADGFQPTDIKELLENLQLFGDALFDEVAPPSDHYLNEDINNIRKVKLLGKGGSSVISENQDLIYSSASITTEITSRAAKSKSLSFKILFTDTPMEHRYVLYKQENDLVLKIAQNDPALSRFIDTDNDGQVDWHSESARIVLAEIITEALARSVVEYEMVQTGAPELDGLSAVDNLYAIFRKYEDAVQKIEDTIYTILMNSTGM